MNEIVVLLFPSNPAQPSPNACSNSTGGYHHDQVVKTLPMVVEGIERGHSQITTSVLASSSTTHSHSLVSLLTVHLRGRTAVHVRMLRTCNAIRSSSRTIDDGRTTVALLGLASVGALGAEAVIVGQALPHDDGARHGRDEAGPEKDDAGDGAAAVTVLHGAAGALVRSSEQALRFIFADAGDVGEVGGGNDGHGQGRRQGEDAGQH